MRKRSCLGILAVLLAAGSLLSGCGSILPPRRLTRAQSSFLARVPRLGVVAVTATQPYPGHGAALRDMLERTGLFERAVLLDPAEPGSAAPEPAYTATLSERCSCRRGGWIPVLPILTLGVVPQFGRCSVGYAFALRETATGRETRIDCDIKSTLAVGWLPALMNVLPGWTLSDAEKSPRFERRLAYSIARRLAGEGSDQLEAPPPGW